MSESAFQCRMCGHCCLGEGGIVVSEKDRQRLAEHLNLSRFDLEENYACRKGDTYYLATQKDGYCIFFHPEKGCGVHPAKPDICRAWPFFLGNLKDEMSWKMAQDFCPGINPRVSHSEFIRQGREHLRSQGLIHAEGDDSAASLQSAQLLRQEPS